MHACGVLYNVCCIRVLHLCGVVYNVCRALCAAFVCRLLYIVCAMRVPCTGLLVCVLYTGLAYLCAYCTLARLRAVQNRCLIVIVVVLGCC
jgi:hypothetical protein